MEDQDQREEITEPVESTATQPEGCAGEPKADAEEVGETVGGEMPSPEAGQPE